jgi:hypothetical protein
MSVTGSVYIAGAITPPTLIERGGSSLMVDAKPGELELFHNRIKKEREELITLLRTAGLIPIDPYRNKDLTVQVETYSPTEIVLRDMADLAEASSVLVLPGWEHSFGVICEIWEARKQGKTIVVVGGHPSLFFDFCVSRVVSTVYEAVDYLKEYMRW